MIFSRAILYDTRVTPVGGPPLPQGVTPYYMGISYQLLTYKGFCHLSFFNYEPLTPLPTLVFFPQENDSILIAFMDYLDPINGCDFVVGVF